MSSLLSDKELASLTGPQRAYSHLVIALCQFVTERVPYADVKTHLKYALKHAVSDPMLTGVIMHNLAVVNYIELGEHNERIICGED